MSPVVFSVADWVRRHVSKDSGPPTQGNMNDPVALLPSPASPGGISLLASASGGTGLAFNKWRGEKGLHLIFILR